MTDKPVFTNRIHQKDCVRALHHLFNLLDVDPVYNLLDSTPTPVNELISGLVPQWAFIHRSAKPQIIS